MLFLLMHGGARRYASALLSHACGALAEAERWGEPHYSTQGDALLVVGEAPGTAASTFDDVDWGWAWEGTLRQMGGPPAVTPGNRLSATTLSGRRLVVVTTPLEAPQLEALSGWVRAGGTLVMQVPTTLAASHVRADGAAVASHAITGLQDCALDAVSRGRLIGMPLHARRWPMHADPGASPLLWIDGEAAAWQTVVGEGTIFTLGFDMGAALVAWRQGLPAVDFTVKERYGSLPLIVESDDLVMDPRMLHNEVPCADLLIRAVLGTACDRGRIPALWPLPEGAPAAFVVTHDDESAGRSKLQGLLDDDARRGLHPTVFVVGHGVESADWQASAVDVELHWNRHFFSDLRRRTLVAQAAAIPQVRVNRTHYLDWGSDWDGPFRALAAAGVRFDCTLGPNAGWGYLFGSGLPYGVLDRRGLPLPLAEIPFEFQEDWGGSGEAQMLTLLDHAVSHDHTAIVALAHADKWMRSEAGRHAYDAVASRAHSSGVWCGDLRGLLEMPTPSIRSKREGRRVVLQADDLSQTLWLRVADSAHLVEARGTPQPQLRRFEDGTTLVHGNPAHLELEYDR